MTDATKPPEPGWYAALLNANGEVMRVGPPLDDVLRDAEHYRWVRSGNRTIIDAELVYDLMDRAVSEQEFDAAIAAEIAREKAKPETEPEPDHSPTWWEGYWAHAHGWELRGHTKQYQAGWKHRSKITEKYRD